LFFDRTDIIKVDVRIHARIADRIAADGEMLHSALVERAAVLAFELREQQRHELRLRAFRDVCQIDLEIFAIRIPSNTQR